MTSNVLIKRNNFLNDVANLTARKVEKTAKDEYLLKFWSHENYV